MSSDIRRKALDVFRQSAEASESERKKRLVLLAQAWLNLADHDARVRNEEAFDAVKGVSVDGNLGWS